MIPNDIINFVLFSLNMAKDSSNCCYNGPEILEETSITAFLRPHGCQISRWDICHFLEILDPMELHPLQEYVVI